MSKSRLIELLIVSFFVFIIGVLFYVAKEAFTRDAECAEKGGLMVTLDHSNRQCIEQPTYIQLERGNL